MSGPEGAHGPEFLWTVPVRTPGRHRFDPSVTDDRPGRFTAFDEYVQVARAAELTGFDGVLVPYDPRGDESWVLGTALAREVPQVEVVVEFPPDHGTAVYAAKMALSFQRFFGNRLSWQVVVDDQPAPALADAVAGAAHARRVEELLTITRGVFGDSPFTHVGEFYEVHTGGFFDGDAVPGLSGLTRPATPHPRVLLAGDGEAGLELSSRYADVHLFDEARPEALARSIDELATRAAAEGRTVVAGLRVGVTARDAEVEARRDAERSGASLQDGTLWTGYQAVGSHAPYGLVGTYGAVAAALVAYVELGITTFVLDGIHPVADAYGVGEYLLPLVADAVAPVPA